MTRTLFRAVLIVLPFLLAAPASAYVESPLLADKVKGGELPPVADRLPTNPRVIDLPAMGRQLGKQGGRIEFGDRRPEGHPLHVDQRLFAARRL